MPRVGSTPTLGICFVLLFTPERTLRFRLIFRMSSMSDELDRCSRTLLQDALAVGDEEQLAIVFDERTDLIDSLERVAEESPFVYELVMIPSDRSHSSPIPDALESLKRVDAVVAPTTYSISHSPETTEAREQAGTRFLTLPGITEEVYRKIGRADAAEIDVFNDELYQQVQDAEQVTITTSSGTDVELRLDPERDWHRDGLSASAPGALSNAPAGEVFVAPLENGAEGRIVIDRWEHLTGEHEAFLDVSGGRIISHNEAARPLIEHLQDAGPSGFVVAELGLGTNRSHEEPIGNILHDEKIYGTCHIAFGMNTSMGGENESSVHEDVVLLEPEITVDGVPLTFPGS